MQLIDGIANGADKPHEGEAGVLEKYEADKNNNELMVPRSVPEEKTVKCPRCNGLGWIKPTEKAVSASSENINFWNNDQEHIGESMKLDELMEKNRELEKSKK